MDKEFTGVLRTYGKRALSRARSNSPVQSGALRNSIKLSVTKKDAALYSNLVYARAHEWGTSPHPYSTRVKPRGVPLAIQRSQMLGNAVYHYRNQVGQELADLVNETARKHRIEVVPNVRQSKWGGGRIISPS